MKSSLSVWQSEGLKCSEVVEMGEQDLDGQQQFPAQCAEIYAS